MKALSSALQVGDRVGEWTVLRIHPSTARNTRRIDLRCSCGRKATKLEKDLIHGSGSKQCRRCALKLIRKRYGWGRLPRPT